jgi:hypothetical protein
MIAVLLCVLGSVTGWSQTPENYLDLNLNQSRYLGGVQHSAQGNNYTSIAGDLNLQRQTEGFAFKLNPIAQGSLDQEDEFYFGVPELYVQPLKIEPWFNLTIGRQKRQWSKLDEEFNLGIWQPQLRWDYLNPVQEGLTGVFFDWSLNSSLRFSFFTSPVNIPDQGPQYTLREGRFESHNRWFEQPTMKVTLLDGTKYSTATPIYYEIDEPSLEDVTMHSSFGLGLRYEAPSTPLWSQINYAYKPRNQIHLGIEGELDISDPEVHAIIHPKIVKHHVLTWESGFDRDDDRGWLSLTGDAPNKSGFPAEYEEAPLNPMLVAGTGYSRYVYGLLGRPSWLGFSYMRAWEYKKDKPKDKVSQDQVESSFDRYPYEEIAAVDWKLQLARFGKDKLNLGTRYNYSIPERGGWLAMLLALNQGPLVWTLGFDVLGAEIDPNAKDAGLFSRYRANDRVFGGMSYVF